MMATPIYDHIRIYEFRLLKFQGEIFIFIFMQGYNNIKISNVRLAGWLWKYCNFGGWKATLRILILLLNLSVGN